MKPALQQEGVSIRACCAIFLCYLAGDFCRTALSRGEMMQGGWLASWGPTGLGGGLLLPRIPSQRPLISLCPLGFP